MDRLAPVARLADLAVVLAHPADGGPRVELVDLRRKVGIFSLTQRDAATLAGLVASRCACPEQPAAGPSRLRVDPDFLGPDDEVHPADDEQVYEDPRPPESGW